MKLPLTPIRCLLRAAQEYPAKVGVVDGEHRLTYAEVLDRSARLAAALETLGVGQGDVVAGLSFNCRQLLELYYGAPLARAILLPLNVRLSVDEQAYILEHSTARAVFFDPEFLPLVEALRKRLPKLRWTSLVDDPGLPAWVEAASYERLLEQTAPLEIDFTTYDEESIAELFYTSGSTGRPKGVMLSHRTLYLHALSVIMAYLRQSRALPADQKVEAHTIPLFHANGWGRAHTVTYMGGRHVMIKRFDPRGVCEIVERERVTCFSMVPTMAAAMLAYPDLDRHDLSSLEEITLGGAASSPTLVRELERRMGCRAVVGYGLTESGPVSTTAHPKDSLGPLDDDQRLQRQAMTGCALPATEVRAVDAEGVDVPRDMTAVGEVWIRSDAVMDGYWREPEATQAAMEGGWLHTGDMAVWDEDRCLLIVDRKKDIIISGGENISSIEIEKVLAAHPAVHECAVVGAPHEKWGETPIAFVTLKPGQGAEAAELRSWVRERLAGFKTPSRIEFRDELPKGATGKILKRVLREPYWEGRERKVLGSGR